MRRVLFFAVCAVGLALAYWALTSMPGDGLKALVLVAGGPGLLIAAPVFLISQIRFRGGAVRTTGVVTRCEDDGPDDAYTLTIEFTTLEGRRQTFTEDRLPRREVGREVPVLYDPSAPEKARYYRGMLAVVATAAVMLLMGAAFSVFAWNEYLRA